MASLDIAVVSLLSSLALGGSVFLFIMLLPALLELKKPQDAGPRVVTEKANFPEAVHIPSLEQNEEEKVSQNLIKKLADVVSVLPNLEE